MELAEFVYGTARPDDQCVHDDHTRIRDGASGVMRPLPGQLPPAACHDQGKEFNVNPSSCGTTSWNPAGGFSSTSTSYCSDCHGNDSPSPSVPHGSAAAKLLIRSHGRTLTAKGVDQTRTDLCFNCHDVTAYQTGTAAALHTQHRILSASSGTSKRGYVCVNCHTLNAHGYRNIG